MPFSPFHFRWISLCPWWWHGWLRRPASPHGHHEDALFAVEQMATVGCCPSPTGNQHQCHSLCHHHHRHKDLICQMYTVARRVGLPKFTQVARCLWWFACLAHLRNPIITPLKASTSWPVGASHRSAGANKEVQSRANLLWTKTPTRFCPDAPKPHRHPNMAPCTLPPRRLHEKPRTRKAQNWI